MIKFRTLKEIVKCPDCKCIDYACVDYEALIQEAIKWGKNLMNAEELMKWTLLDWIKYFFNLSEEDLMTNEEINMREFGEKANN